MIKTETVRHRSAPIVRGKIIYSQDISMKIISGRQLCFETSLYIKTNSICKVELVADDNEKRKFTVKTLSSVLKRHLEEKGDRIPIYEVWIEFNELNDIEKQFLDKLHNNLGAPSVML